MRLLHVAPSPPDSLVALRRGDVAALSAVYREHGPALLMALTALLSDRAEAEDLVHDLFVGLPEALGRYEERGTFGSWLHRMAIRLGLTRLRTRKRRGEVSLDHASLHGHPADSEGLGDRLLIEAALAQLPEESRAVVVMRDLEGWSYRDIAEFVGASEGTVMTRHCRAMQRLKAALEETR